VDISFVIPVKDEEGTLRDLYKGIVENTPLNLSFEVIFIYINTPSKDDREVDLSQVISSAKSISKFLKNSRNFSKNKRNF
jgi:UDP-N-acetyl-D-mannosaminuronate dehydrogenase